MKNSNVCPKCKSENIAKVKPEFSASRNVFDVIPLGKLKGAIGTKYVCLNCGYTELYFAENDLPKIKEKYGENCL